VYYAALMLLSYCNRRLTNLRNI